MPAEPTHDRELRRALRRGVAEDARFDELYPAVVRAVSGVFWTPLSVAAQAAELFEEQRVESILDVGSGPGKFCLAAAMAGPTLELTGIEHRPHLVGVAREAARRLRLTNVRFQLGDVTSVDWSQYDGFYLFNPFAENLFAGPDRYDGTVPLCADKRAADIELVERALVAARLGTTVVTYHGFGGRIPSSFRLARSLKSHTDWLNVWVKDGVGPAKEGFWIERADEDTGAPLFFEAEDGEAPAPA